MSFLARLRNVFRADRVASEIEREIAFHLAELEDDLVASGKSRAEARRAARSRFRDLTKQADNTRSRDLIGWLESIVADVHYAWRGFRSAPGFAAVAVLSLALGIGANTAIFTLLNVVMLEQLPVSHPEELVQLTDSSDPEDKNASTFRPGAWQLIRERQDVFSGVFAYGSTGSADLSTGGEARPIALGLVSGGFFSTLGVRAAVGRLLLDADDYDGCNGVVVITHAFWQSEFGRAASVVGKSLQINGRPFEIVGVAERRFFGLGYGYYPPVWAPQCAGKIIRGPGYEAGGNVVGRLKPGVTMEEARARMRVLTASIREANITPDLSADEVRWYRGLQYSVEPFARGFRFLQQEYGSALLALMAIVAVVLLIACANIANLLLARATARQRELAIRRALGATRLRLVRQFVTESLLLSLSGAAIGVLFAVWGSNALVGFLSRRGRPILQELSPDWKVLAFTIAAGCLCALISGPAPAWCAVQSDPTRALKTGGRGVAEGYSRFRFGKALIVAQIALSLTMTAAAGLLVSSWRRLATMDPGFHSSGVALVHLNARAAGIPERQLAASYQRILDRLRTIPGVTAASAANRTPIGTTNWNAAIEIPGNTAPAGGERIAQLNEVSEHYFATMGVRRVAGRDFDKRDVPGSRKVAIVNEEFVRRFLARSPALGSTFAIRWGDEPTEYEIVAVVADTKDEMLQEQAQPIVYFPLSQNQTPEPYVNFAARTEGDASRLLPLMSAAILEEHPRLSLTSRTLQEQLDESIRLPRTLGLLSAFFTGLALLLASIGLYGIMAYTTARRRNEIGVRIALGAHRSRILRMVLGDVLAMVVPGVVIGVAIALAVQRLMTSLLFSVEPGDLATLMISALTLAAVAFLAAAAPAWRAARLDPLGALREG